MAVFRYWDDITRDIVNAGSLMIYGAGLMGRELLECLIAPPYSKNVSGFIVGDGRDNPEEIGGVPIRGISDRDIARDVLVIVALHEKNLQSAIDALGKEGYGNVRIVSFDSDAWNHIRGNWIRSEGLLEDDCVFQDEVDIPKVCVYIANSEVDKNIDDIVPIRDYEVPIQVGRKIGSKTICALGDDDGDNISEKNRQYCELTALYWIWKHRKSEYMGLSHYRRRFKADGFRYENLIGNNIDMVVTMPILNNKGVRTQYGLDHSIEDWDTMMNVIEELSPEYLDSARIIQDSTYYYGYNMFIARYDVFCDYCEWLFCILNECERRIGAKADRYQNRYIGNLSERMLGIYINKHKLRIMVADKFFIDK